MSMACSARIESNDQGPYLVLGEELRVGGLGLQSALAKQVGLWLFSLALSDTLFSNGMGDKPCKCITNFIPAWQQEESNSSPWKRV